MDDYAKYLQERARLAERKTPKSNYGLLLVANLLLVVTVLALLSMIAFLLKG